MTFHQSFMQDPFRLYPKHQLNNDRYFTKSLSGNILINKTFMQCILIRMWYQKRLNSFD